MIGTKRTPQGLLFKTLIVTFSTVTVLLLVVFQFVRVSVRNQVRQAIVSNLDVTQGTLAAVETRRQREVRAQAAALAESPTLKAALDTYTAELTTSDAAATRQLLTTIRRELDKLLSRVESDAIILTDTHATTLTAVGRLADRWPEGRALAVLAPTSMTVAFDGVLRSNGDTFQAVTVPLMLDDGVTIGALFLATALDRHYAEDLDRLARARIAVVNDGVVIASTLPQSAAGDLEAALTNRSEQGVVSIAGTSYAFRQLLQAGTARSYALSSIDEPLSAATSQTNRSLAAIAAGAFLLALVASALLASMLTRPIGQLSASMAQMAASNDVEARLRPTGSSRELDALTATFNTVMASLADAKAQTEAAYAGAIRALAAALDARDPYTAGHSDRVSVLSVAIGRVLPVDDDDLEVLRLGALLHDIGKIGISDEVLRKAGPLTPREYDIIKQHPVVGAKILRTVPFLAPHIPIVELHHERPDGCGYPHGLTGEDTPLLARIVHVADAYDAITSARAYRAARSSREALEELWRSAGTEFDAEIVGALAMALPGVVTTMHAAMPEALSA